MHAGILVGWWSAGGRLIHHPSTGRDIERCRGPRCRVGFRLAWLVRPVGARSRRPPTTDRAPPRRPKPNPANWGCRRCVAKRTIGAMAQLSYLESVLGRRGALSHCANQVKRLGQQQGATVEITQAELTVGTERQTIFVAGINSSARWEADQLELLATWHVRIAPSTVRRGSMESAPHAEENIGAYLQSIGGRGVRWSCALVGALYRTESGSNSYVCSACQGIIKRVGGVVEDPYRKSRYSTF